MQDPLASPLVPLGAGLFALFALGLHVAFRVPDAARGRAARLVVTRVCATSLIVTGISLYLAKQGMGAGNPFIRGVVQAFVTIASLSLVSVITLHHVGQIASRPATVPPLKPGRDGRDERPARLSGRQIGLGLVGIIVVLAAVLGLVALQDH